MNITFYGTSGSIPAPGPSRVLVGGNTPCVLVQSDHKHTIILDAGSGLRELGYRLPKNLDLIDIFISHYHLDHIYGLGFFTPLFEVHREIHIWGPGAQESEVRSSLNRFLSPPLFPVRLEDFKAKVHIHAVPTTSFKRGDFLIDARPIKHSGLTLGYRLNSNNKILTYLPDHEPFSGQKQLPDRDADISGFELAHEADLLIHDAQFTDAEYDEHIGWGHSCISQTIKFATRCRVKALVTFSHDPSHSDELILEMARAANLKAKNFDVAPGIEGQEIII